MATANEDLFDAAVRHQVNLQRLSAGEAKKIVAMLDKSDKELASLISKRAGGLTTDFTSKRWVAMRTEIARTRSAVIRSIGGDITETLQDLAVLEQDVAKLALQKAVPVEMNFATTAPAQLRAMAENKPFGGADTMQTIGEWISDLADADQRRITGALQAGVTNGETIPQITRRIEKATDLTKTNAEAISRTGVNHISNSAREEFFKENDSVIQALRWTSTLDGRTSAICRARDGQFTHIEGTNPEGQNIPSPRIQGSPTRPPAHLRCRSLMIAVLDSEAVADAMPERPFVRDARTRRKREIDFRKQAKDKNADWSQMSREQRRDAITGERRAWSKENIGQVPGGTTYDEWLRRQPESFQNDVLGPTKAAKFREGLTMDQFVDRQGNELTIDQLKDKTPPASAASGAEREIQKARDLDAKAKRAEGRAAKAAERETEARKAKEKHEADAKKARDEQAKLDADAKAEAEQRKQAKQDKLEADRKASVEKKRKKTEEKVEANRAKAESEAKKKKARIAAEKKATAETVKKLEPLDIGLSGAEKKKALRNNKFAQSLTPDQQDAIFGADRANLLRRGATVQQVVRDGKLRSLEELVDDFPRDIRSSETMKWTPELQDKWRPGKEAKAVLKDWGGASHEIRNTQMKLGTIDAGMRSRLKALDAALAKAPAYDGEIWRGLGLTRSEIDELVHGAVFRMRAHASSSVRSQVAWRFGVLQSGRSLIGDGQTRFPVLYRMRQKSGVMIMGHTGKGLEHEAEVLVKKGTKYRVTGVHDEGDFTVIEMEEI